MIFVLEARDFLDFVILGHLGSCNCGIPPQILLFPIIDIASIFLKTPTVGSEPSIFLRKVQINQLSEVASGAWDFP